MVIIAIAIGIVLIISLVFIMTRNGNKTKEVAESNTPQEQVTDNDTQSNPGSETILSPDILPHSYNNLTAHDLNPFDCDLETQWIATSWDHVCIDRSIDSRDDLMGVDLLLEMDFSCVSSTDFETESFIIASRLIAEYGIPMEEVITHQNASELPEIMSHTCFDMHSLGDDELLKVIVVEEDVIDQWYTFSQLHGYLNLLSSDSKVIPLGLPPYGYDESSERIVYNGYKYVIVNRNTDCSSEFSPFMQVLVDRFNTHGYNNYEQLKYGCND